jgi:glycosyltransferase involved in cell wall biosynthesis
MKRIVVSVINDLVTDQRVHRISSTLHEYGNRVLLVGRVLPESLPLQRVYDTHRMRCKYRRGFFFFAEYNIRLFFFLLFRKFDILVSNDLDTLPANFFISLIRRKPLVYDSHEYFTGVPELDTRPKAKVFWEKMESLLFPRLKYIYTVNESIANLYRQKYRKNIHVVRNVPVRISKNSWPERSDLGLPENKKIVILQGAGININRGAEEAIQSMKYLDGTILLIIGGGDVVHLLNDIVLKEGVGDKVLFKPKMPYEQLMSYTRLADVGITLDKDTNINYRFSLPNKLFDYIQAGIPVLCSNLVEVAGIVKKWDVGMVADNHDPEHIAQRINEMLIDLERYKIWKANLAKAAEELSWDNEKQRLLEVYKDLL